MLQSAWGDVGQYADISEYVLGASQPAESDAEDGPDTTFSDSRDLKRAIRLIGVCVCVCDLWVCVCAWGP